MLTLQFIPYQDIEGLSSDDRIKKILSIVKDDKIVVMEGKLEKQEEAELIQATMEHINLKFKGIEIGVISPEASQQGLGRKIKYSISNLLLGDRSGMTVVGPATVVREIKRDPGKVQVLTNDRSEKKRRRK